MLMNYIEKCNRALQVCSLDERKKKELVKLSLRNTPDEVLTMVDIADVLKALILQDADKQELLDAMVRKVECLNGQLGEANGKIEELNASLEEEKAHGAELSLACKSQKDEIKVLKERMMLLIHAHIPFFRMNREKLYHYLSSFIVKACEWLGLNVQMLFVHVFGYLRDGYRESVTRLSAGDLIVKVKRAVVHTNTLHQHANSIVLNGNVEGDILTDNSTKIIR